MQRSEDVQSTMKTVDDDMKLVVVQLDAIGASLDELMKPDQADTKEAFDLFSDHASKIKEMERDFTQHAFEMEASGKAYFKEWNNENQNYDNTDIQRKSSEQRVALGETYTRLL